jgi:hypothetical protein
LKQAFVLAQPVIVVNFLLSFWTTVLFELLPFAFGISDFMFTLLLAGFPLLINAFEWSVVVSVFSCKAMRTHQWNENATALLAAHACVAFEALRLGTLLPAAEQPGAYTVNLLIGVGIGVLRRTNMLSLLYQRCSGAHNRRVPRFKEVYLSSKFIFHFVPTIVFTLVAFFDVSFAGNGTASGCDTSPLLEPYRILSKKHWFVVPSVFLAQLASDGLTIFVGGCLKQSRREPASMAMGRGHQLLCVAKLTFCFPR